jgi:hypothetical protein
MTITFIPKAECKDRKLYRIKSRNLLFGVYRAETGGFLGLREKFGSVYVFEEYHWENKAFATVRPQEELPVELPAEIPLAETLGTICTGCKKPVDYIHWPEGGEREIEYAPESFQKVKGQWKHLVETDCKKA